MDLYNARKTITARTGPTVQEGSLARRAVETVDYLVSMSVDGAAIMDRLAKKAALSKAGRATTMHGLIVVTVKKAS